MYQVTQDGKPCAEYNFKSWDKDTFPGLEEAIIFAYHWAYPYDYDFIVRSVNNKLFVMEPDKDYDMGMSETPIIMRINTLTH